MSSSIAERLKQLGHELPSVPAARGMFSTYSISGNLLFLAGQICEWNGEVLYSGQVGSAQTLETGQAAARVCALNLFAVVKDVVDDDIGRVVKVHRLGGFVNTVPGFPFVPAVINGASAVFIELLGEIGRHARTAVGVATLPMNATAEVDAILELR